MPSTFKRFDPSRVSLRSIAVTAMLLCVLLVQEYALIGIPNVQLTVVLLMVYASVLPWRMILPLTAAYVFLDSFFMGSLSPIYLPSMLFAWLLLVLVTKLIAKQALWVFVLTATLFGFVYGWCFLVPQIFLFSIDPWAYLAADFLFEMIMAITNLITVSFLYPVLKPILMKLLHPEMDSGGLSED